MNKVKVQTVRGMVYVMNEKLADDVGNVFRRAECLQLVVGEPRRGIGGITKELVNRLLKDPQRERVSIRQMPFLHAKALELKYERKRSVRLVHIIGSSNLTNYGTVERNVEMNLWVADDSAVTAEFDHLFTRSWNESEVLVEKGELNESLYGRLPLDATAQNQLIGGKGGRGPPVDTPKVEDDLLTFLDSLPNSWGKKIRSREYQVDSLRALDRHVGDQPILGLPPGAGKTVVAAAFAKWRFTDADKKVLWVAERKTLLDQAASTFTDDLGVPQSALVKYDEDPDGPFSVCFRTQNQCIQPGKRPI